MPGRKELTLTAEERQELKELRDNHELPYVRERAAALLKIADGMSGRQVALKGLLKNRRPDTIYEWVQRWKKEGLQGLFIRKGRGRKSSFSPSVHNPRGGP